jgi:hypothetical protein
LLSERIVYVSDQDNDVTTDYLGFDGSDTIAPRSFGHRHGGTRYKRTDYNTNTRLH